MQVTLPACSLTGAWSHGALDCHIEHLNRQKLLQPVRIFPTPAPWGEEGPLRRGRGIHLWAHLQESQVRRGGGHCGNPGPEPRHVASARTIF